MSAVSQTAATPAVRISVRVLAHRLSLPLIFVASSAYQFLQSRAHVAPTVFSDELLYAKLSQAIAAGHGLALRGVHYAFPAPVAPLLQAPAWLFSSMTEGYAAAKLLNAVIMSAAVFPAYWLARSVVRRSFALSVAAATVATPAMLYHAYLMSEAAAYPVFLLAIAVSARAAAQPSRRYALAVPLVCALAVATRVQFLVLPIAYLAAVAVCGRKRYRRYVVPVSLLGLLGSAVALIPGSLGSYGAAGEYRYAPGAVGHWLLTDVSLLPFSLGLAVVPGALLGAGFALFRARSQLERSVALVAATTATLFLLEAALVSAGEAHRPLERYLFYVTPLVFLSFFAYVERGAPRRIVHLAVAGVVALLLSQVSLAGLTGTAGFFFDSVTESAFARAVYVFGLSPASLLFALLPVALAVLAVAVPLRRPTVAIAVATVATGVMLVGGTAVASTDHLVTAWTQRTFGTTPPDWLDRSHLGRARYLVLPDSNPFYGTSLESWNRNIEGLVLLGAPAPDAFARSVAHVRADGVLEIDGRPAAPQLVVANVSGSQLGIDGRIVAKPRAGLVAIRIPRGARVRWLAQGLGPDGWIGTWLVYRVWPAGSRGRYVLTFGLPDGYAPRHVVITVGPIQRTITVASGTRVRFVLPTQGDPLRVDVEVPPGPLNGRALGVLVPTLRYEP
jgi:hypothetical protein